MVVRCHKCYPNNMNTKVNLKELIGVIALGLLVVSALYLKPVSEMPFESGVLIAPEGGVVLPVVWGDLGKRMVESGVIDQDKFLALYENNPVLKEEAVQLIRGTDSGNLKITRDNSGIVLNLLWAFGLGNKNRVLDEGPMAQYGDPGRFASTGGWTVAQGNAMDHYSRHSFATLTEDEQRLVEEVAQNIYRPCCDNSTHFPDCNHGMAMLGLLELLASEGISEKDMYRVALQVNSYWFPDTYLTISKYLEVKGVSWGQTDPKEILGYAYSSGSGYRNVLTEVTPSEIKSGGSCGV